MKLDETTLIKIEDYIQALDENVELKIETIKDIAQAITKHRGLVEKLTIPVVSNHVNCVGCGVELSKQEITCGGNCCDCCISN